MSPHVLVEAASAFDLAWASEELLGFRTGGLGERVDDGLAAGDFLTGVGTGAFFSEVGVLGGASADGSGSVATMFAGL